MPAQPHAAQNIDFKKSHPVGVGDFFERLWLKNAKVIHQDVYFRKRLDRFSRALCCSQIGSQSLDFSDAF